MEGTAQIGFILEKLNSRGAVKYARERGDPIGGSRCELHEKKDDTFRHVIKLDFYNPDKNDMILTHEKQQPKEESNQINLENLKFCHINQLYVIFEMRPQLCRIFYESRRNF